MPIEGQTEYKKIYIEREREQERETECKERQGLNAERDKRKDGEN